MCIMFKMCCDHRRALHATPEVEVRVDTTWVHDTIVTAGPVVVREEVREVPAMIDTAEIIQRYYTARTLSDTFHLRDMATVRITDTVFENNIIGRTIDYDLASLQVSANVRPVRLALTAGMQVGANQAAVMGGLRFKRTEVGAAYDMRLRAPSVYVKYDLKQWR